jgi:hypothetical protein
MHACTHPHPIEPGKTFVSSWKEGEKRRGFPLVEEKEAFYPSLEAKEVFPLTWRKRCVFRLKEKGRYGGDHRKSEAVRPSPRV